GAPAVMHRDSAARDPPGRPPDDAASRARRRDQALRKAAGSPRSAGRRAPSRPRGIASTAAPLLPWYPSRPAIGPQTTQDAPHPHVRFTLGFRRLNPEAISSSL